MNIMLDANCPVIVFSADNRYAMPLAVAMLSMSMSLRKYAKVQVIVIDGGISRRNKTRIRASVPVDKVHIQWVTIPKGLLINAPVFGHVSRSAYYRLALAELLPAEVDKTIYLDVDIVVLGDIGELWDTDMGDCVLLAAQEANSKISDPAGLSMYKELNLNGDTPYFNSGVLVINLKMWRERNYTAKAENFLRTYQKQIQYWDQDVLNAISAGEWGGLSVIWNYRLDQTWPGDPQALCTIDLARSHLEARIVHFASAIKPWQYGALHPATQLYFSLIDETRWRGWRPRPALFIWGTMRRRVFNKHWYGKWLRKIPLFAQFWKLMLGVIRRAIKAGESRR